MRQIGHFVLGLERGRDVLDRALLERHRAGLAGTFGQHRGDLGAVERGLVAHLPDHGQRIAALLGRPVAIGQHGHAGVDGDHLPHALDCLGCGLIEALWLDARVRRARHHGNQHAVDPGIDAELGRAIGLGRCVEPARGLAQDLEVSAGLEQRLFRHGLLGSQRHQGAISDLLAAGRDDLAALAAQLVGRQAPLLGGRCHQHLARRGAGLAHRRPVRPHRGGAAGGLHAEHGVVVGRVHRCLLDADQRPVGLQLFSDQHRNRGEHALAHLGRAADHRDLVVRRDAQPGVGRKGIALRGGGAAAEWQREADGQGRSAGGDLQEFASVDLAHDQAPLDSEAEASLMAARIWL